MEYKYYFGYAINPEEVRTSDFDDNTKIRCVIKNDGNEYRELLTDARYFPIKENQVIDGNKIFDMDASLIGTIEKEAPLSEIVDFIYKNENDKKEYENLFFKLIYNTRQKAIDGKKEYLNMENTFKEEVNKKKK